MKTLRYLILTAIALVGLCASAQMPKGSLGIRSAMEITIPGSNSAYSTGAGFTLGLTYKMPLSPSLDLESQLLYYYSTMSAKNNVVIDGFQYQDAAKYMGIRLPVMVRKNVPLLENLDMTFATGPWFNFNIYARQNILPNLAAPVPVPNRRINLFDHGWKRFDAQWGFKLYFTFAGSYRIGIDGGVAFTPLASFGNKDKKIRVYRNTVAVSLGYIF